MRIFKNRGDIYIPQTKFKSDLEQKILLIGLVCIVVFTSIFLLAFGIKYDFSVKKFFKPDNVKVEVDVPLEELPDVEGKTNFLFILSNDETEEMYYSTIIQVDLDTISYKASTLDPNTVVDDKKLQDYYSLGGAGNVVNAVSKLFGTEIDYYIDEDLNSFKKMFDSMGKIRYTVTNDIKYKDTSYYGYNLKIKNGEQTIDGETVEKLTRYFVNKAHNYEEASNVFLNSISQQLNSENYAKKEKLFSTFIDCSKTNISVKNFTENINALKVLTSDTTGVNVYSVSPKYEGSKVTSSSINEIKGYFAK